MVSLLKKTGFFILDLLRPFFELISKRKKNFFVSLRQNFKKDPYLCGMITRFGIWHEWIFKPYFEKVKTNPDETTSLKGLSNQGTLVYVMKNRGQLEYSFFNHYFLKEGIPLANFANGCRTLFWRPFAEIFKAGLARLDNYYQNGLLEDPLQSGYLEDLVAGGRSALLNLKVSREFIFGASEDPLEFITPLILAAQKSSRPIFLMTQQFLYDRHPEKSKKSLIDLIFGEKSNPGMFRKLILFMMSYRKRASVKFGEAFDLKKFVEERRGTDNRELAGQLKNILLERLSVERKSITGPTLKPREKFLEGMLRSRSFKKDIEDLIEKTGRSRGSIEKEVSRYFMEIAASVNYSYVDLYDFLIRWMINNIYDGLDVNTEALAKIKAVAGKNPIVLVPSHKSHIDYLLISYLFYNYDLTLPHICAGINLKFWPVSRFIRRGGGFYIRRSFSDNKIYKVVLEHYLKMLIREGYSVEFFIEGTRSRTGKLLKPRMGILSMIMRAYLDGEADDIYFIPLSINYERVMEQKSYLEEVHGSKKEKENVRGMLKARKEFRRKYGKVFVRFADPVSLKDFLKEKGVEPKQKTIDECRREVEDFAYRLTYEINRSATVTSTSLVASSLLSYPRKGIPEEAVIKRARTLQHYLEYKGAELSGIVRQKEEWAYREALQKLASERLITAYQDFHEKFYTIDESRRILLDFHKNNSIHYFVSIACFSKIILTSGKAEMTLDDVRKKYEVLKRLLWQDFTFSERAPLDSHLLRLIDFCVQEELIAFDESCGKLRIINYSADRPLELYASLLDNYFESLYFTLLYIKHVPVDKVEMRKLVNAVLQAGKVLYLKGDLGFPEALSHFNITNAVNAFASMGLVQIEEGKFVSSMADQASINQWEEILRSLLGMDENVKKDRETRRVIEGEQLDRIDRTNRTNRTDSKTDFH